MSEYYLKLESECKEHYLKKLTIHVNGKVITAPDPYAIFCFRKRNKEGLLVPLIILWNIKF